MKQDELLEKYRKILEVNAERLSRKRRGDKDYWKDYWFDYWFNEGYLALLETYHKNPSITSEGLISAFNKGLRNSDRKELIWEKRNLPYGLGFEPDSEDDSQTEAQKAHYKMAMEKGVKEEQERLLGDVLNGLGKREGEILNMYFFDRHKEKEIAKYYNISIAMVSKIKKRALKKCRKFLEKGVDK